MMRKGYEVNFGRVWIRWSRTSYAHVRVSLNGRALAVANEARWTILRERKPGIERIAAWLDAGLPREGVAEKLAEVEAEQNQIDARKTVRRNIWNAYENIAVLQRDIAARGRVLSKIDGLYARLRVLQARAERLKALADFQADGTVRVRDGAIVFAKQFGPGTLDEQPRRD